MVEGLEAAGGGKTFGGMGSADPLRIEWVKQGKRGVVYRERKS